MRASGTWTREAEEALHRAVAAPQAIQVLQGHTGAVNDVVYTKEQLVLKQQL